ncbi:hypothetical protein K493DRAFT_318120 [Basidiobolus meristosporus CBS 931.73]|uniref:Extracellular membrane protein CFEM domain-containing protein n=1 Tax=Basidiobolus meristosporus CBS 931.73 TaxID=1314790 RepID=A0A1Y1XWS7_9FUNG|nr:hypothetical protein K493DRAFT_318120 [Basidiobolus meristosporus CBS 931.73]|eukprot:ORX90219.1 hypothetical protein K493DRAFT_318120 [Basidiobolus meristosporus CBS 931.73]
MRLTYVLLPLATFVGTSLAATSCLPALSQTSACEDPATYNLCRSNALNKLCSVSDLQCNCMQAKEFVFCTQYCRQDANVTAALNTCQAAEQEKQCKDVPLESQTYSTTAPKPTKSSNVNILTDAGSRTWLAIEYVALISSGVAALLL